MRLGLPHVLSTTCALLLAGLAVPAVAVAAADDPGGSLFGQPVLAAPTLSPEEEAERRAAFEAMLEERGWEVHGDVIGPPELFVDPPVLTDGAASEHQERMGDWNYPPHRATIFLNFFGGPMTTGTNAALMQSTCIPAGGFSYPGFNGTEAQALAIIEVFESKLAPYGVRLAYEKAPPPELPYAMVMMGGTPQMIGMSPGVLGVSCSSDCGDRWWRDATLAFTGAASGNQTNTLATTALHEAAHAFGLGHIDTSNNSSYIMHPYVDNKDRSWAQGCTNYNDATGGINCKAIHDIWCGGGAQDTHAELLAYFGVNSPDTIAPEVTILSPEDNLELAPGGSIELQVEVEDDHDGVGWKLMVYQNDELVDERPAFVFEKKWAINNLPEGTYVFRVQAIDHERNIGADEIRVYVGTAAEDPTDKGESEGGESGDAAGTSDGSAGSDGSDGSDGSAGGGESGLSGGDGDGDDAEGCACRSADRPAPAGGLLLVAGLFGLLRRRRA